MRLYVISPNYFYDDDLEEVVHAWTWDSILITYEILSYKSYGKKRIEYYIDYDFVYDTKNYTWYWENWQTLFN